MPRRSFVKFLLGALLAIPLLLEGYSRLGVLFDDFHTQDDLPSPNDATAMATHKVSSASAVNDDGWTDIQHVTLVFHGASGQDRYTDMLMERLGNGAPVNSNDGNTQTSSNRFARASENSFAILLDWQNLSSNILQASYNGIRFGRQTAGKLLAKDIDKLETIHIVGISVGAFAADAMCRELRSKVGISGDKDSGNIGGPPFIQLTLLDPFQQKGILDVNYGTRSFGLAADYAQQYLNTDDPVPSTNVPVRNAACYDVTPIRPQDMFGHDWPVLYFASQVPNIGIVPPSQRLQRGSVVRIESN